MRTKISPFLTASGLMAVAVTIALFGGGTVQAPPTVNPPSTPSAALGAEAVPQPRLEQVVQTTPAYVPATHTGDDAGKDLGQEKL